MTLMKTYFFKVTLDVSIEENYIGDGSEDLFLLESSPFTLSIYIK